MQAVRIETTIDQDGEVRLTKLPFRPGEQVEVIVRSRGMQPGLPQRLSLRGMPIEYDRPTDPVAEEDWSARL